MNLNNVDVEAWALLRCWQWLVWLSSLQGGPLKSTVTGVEMFKKILDYGQVTAGNLGSLGTNFQLFYGL